MVEPLSRFRGCTALTVALAVMVAFSAAPRPARAQRVSDDERRARQLSYEGEQAYAEGQFEEAALLIRRAYALFPAPVLLHNLGRALESAGDEVGAEEAYSRYLEEMPDADNRAHVEGRLTILRAEIAEDAARELAAADADGEVPVDREQPAEEPGASTGMSAGPFIVGGVGVAALVAGAVTGALALGEQSAAQDEPIQETAREHLDQGETLALTTNILLVGGGVLLAAGVTWLIFELTGDDGGAGDSALEVGLGPGSITVAGQF